MKLYDITQELFSCVVYPGDPTPQKHEEKRISRGDLYNLTAFSMCTHNGTHIDAPFHFLQDGDTVEQIPLDKTVGFCYVAAREGALTADDAAQILQNAASAHPDASHRILFKGNTVVTEEAAAVFADAQTYLIGVESQSVGSENAPMAVHKILLAAKTVLLEGIRLNDVTEGIYFLSAAPLSLAGSDGAPCRAILIGTFGWE